MTGDRYVLLGLAPARAEWFRAVAHWCNAATIPAEFVKCVSAAQARAHLSSGRQLSAVLVDVAAPGFDRDLVDGAGRAGVPVLVVGGDADVGTAVLPLGFGPDALLDALAAHAAAIGPVDAAPLTAEPAPRGWRGRVVSVCGPGGTGVSTLAIALAQGLAGNTLLADLKLHAEQAALHDARDVVPGVQELVEAHRTRRASLEEVRGLTFHVADRGYDLLLGVRRAQAWSTLRPRAFEAAFDSLRGAWAAVVCDTDADVEGERECGSVDVEERHVMARTAHVHADVALVVGLPGMKGVHSLVRVVNDLLAFGVGSARIVPVVNRAPRSPRARAEMAKAVAGLCRSPVAPPVFVPERRVDELLRDGARLPPVLTGPLLGAFAAVRGGRFRDVEPERIAPGSIGAWAEG
jgi:MinD-like ATPase involved in chromosome partitioning or flagellar assembly